MLPGVSVIVTTAGSRPLEPVLEPLLGDAATREIVVVVDGDRDVRLPGDVRLARTQNGEHGDGAGRQAGLEVAREDVLVFVDDDVIPEPGLVSGHAAHHAPHTHRVVLGYMPVELGRVRTPDDLAAPLYQEGYAYMCDGYEQDSGAVLHNFWAGNFSVRRDDALRVGVGGPLSGVYHSDRDFGLRCREAGLEPVFDRSLAARHDFRRTWAEFCRDGRRQGGGRLRLHTRHEALLGPLRLDVYEEGLTPAARSLLRLSRRPRALAVLRPALHAAAAVSCAAWRPAAALSVARLTRSIEQQHGTIEHARTLAEQPG